MLCYSASQVPKVSVKHITGSDSDFGFLATPYNQVKVVVILLLTNVWYFSVSSFMQLVYPGNMLSQRVRVSMFMFKIY